ncbi:MAG: PadR family transcriptional regulator [Bacteroidetes bacterium]|nr:PadR family transcriptional regulator [Bacteroidota bacterium]
MRLLTRAEEFVLLAVWRLQDDAYSIPIRKQISAITGRNWSLGAVYMPLERLVKKGYLDSYLSETTPERGGRHKRIYRLTREGKRALIRIREVQQAMWAGIPQLSLEAS